MNQSEFQEITCTYPSKCRKILAAIGFGVASDWLKNWRESFKPIPKRSNNNRGITIDGNLKTAPINMLHCNM